MSTASRVAWIFSAAALLGSAASATSADGDPYSLRRLQPSRTFGRRGPIRSIAAGTERIDGLSCVALDSAGRVVVAGNSVRRTDPDADDPVMVPAIARFLPGGRLDRSFGGNGIVKLPLTGFVHALALDREDRIAISGRFVDPADASKITAVVRVLADGTPDPEFGQGGFVRFDRLAAPTFRRLAADPRDDALVGVHFGSVSSVITRLTATGELDAEFGTGGSAPIPPSSIGLAIDSQGRCVVSADRAIVRVLPDGTQDPTFGDGGVLRGPHGVALGSHVVAIDGQQRIVVFAGELGFTGNISRFLPTGQLDAGFGEGGVASIPVAAPGDTEAPELSFGVSHGPVARYAFASTLHIYARNLSRQKPVFGSLVQAIDPDSPRTLASRVATDPRGTKGSMIQTYLNGVAVSDDGTTAYAAGWTEVIDRHGRWVSQTPVLLALDLRHPPRASLPDFTTAWAGQPAAVRSAESLGLMLRFTGTVRVANTGRGDAANVRVACLLSDDDVPSNDDVFLFDQPVGPLRSGQSRALQLDSPGFGNSDMPTAGKFLITVVNHDRIVPESDLGNDADVSPTPLE